MYEISKRLFVNEVTLQVLLFSTTEQCLPTPQLQTDRHSTAACRLEPVRETPAHRAPLPIAQHWWRRDRRWWSALDVTHADVALETGIIS